ncbi:MAG TPA: hypothetical protein VLV78_17660 [Thermoanaerobaculia bacterium]|nr:hypothetical protein [Thermoanaerobaculia bacterium]
MLEQLDRIVLADEECVSRLDFASKRANRETEDARAAHEQAVDAAKKGFVDSLDREIQAILAEGEARVREKRAASEAYVSRLAASAEARLETAAEQYARIVTGEAEETSS